MAAQRPRSDVPPTSTPSVRELEKAGGHVSIDHQETIHNKSSIETESRFTGNVKLRYVAPVFFVSTLFIVAVGALLFLSPMLVLINNKEQLTNDLNDSLYAYHTYSQRILGGQLGNRCDDDTITCKFKTLSPMLQQRFEQYGFTVEGEETSTGRYNNATIRAPGSARAANSASSLSSIRKNNSRIDALIERVYSSRNGMYQDRQFPERLRDRFGLVQENTIGSCMAEDFKESFDRRVAYGDQRYVDPDETPTSAPGSCQKSQDEIDENGQGVYSFRSLNELSQEAWSQQIYPNVLSKSQTHLSAACALSTYADLMENSLYRANRVSAARFAMNYLAVADDLKARAGNTGMHTAVDYMANSLLQSNSSGHNGMNARTYTIPALGDTPQVTGELPVLAQLSTLLQSSALRFALFPLAAGEPLTATAVQTGAPGRSADQLCAHGMTMAQQNQERSGQCYSPGSLPLATQVAPVVAVAITAIKREIELVCIGSLAAVLTLIKVPISVEVTLKSTAAMTLLSGIEANKFSADTTGRQAQNIIFSGAGEILGDRAQSLGMRPSDRESFRRYHQAAQVAREDIERTERSLARLSPWDITNQYSFLGSIAAKLVPSGLVASQSWHSGVLATLSAIPASFATVMEASARAAYTQPMHLQPTRLSPANSLACGVDVAVSTDIMLDIACNTRYSMSAQELSLGVDEILEYMLAAHPENAQQSLSDINGRDFGADPATGERMKREAEEGANAPYIDSSGKPNKYTEYAKFLTYCTNRYNQWGQVGMAVEELDEQYVEDEEIDGVRVSHGNSLLRTKPELTTKPESYYGYGWGSSADQDWYTGKKCAEDSEMLSYFRGYTMACSVLAGMSAARQCWHDDTVPSFTQDDFYTTNNIIFKSAS